MTQQNENSQERTHDLVKRTSSPEMTLFMSTSAEHSSSAECEVHIVTHGFAFVFAEKFFLWFLISKSTEDFIDSQVGLKMNFKSNPFTNMILHFTYAHSHTPVQTQNV